MKKILFNTLGIGIIAVIGLFITYGVVRNHARGTTLYNYFNNGIMWAGELLKGKNKDYKIESGGDYAMGSSPKFESEEIIFTDPVNEKSSKVQVKDTLGLRIYYPDYSKIDLVCGEMPEKRDKSVIMFAEAASTGEILDEFAHSNTAGDHVSGGKKYKGYVCKRNTGAFVYYNDTPKFVYKDYSKELNDAANNGGCGFTQEMMIHDGKIVPHTRPDDNTNEFRALCLIDGKVAVADSQGDIKFGDFINDLMKAGATEALYLDMGPGWNYSWYRDSAGNPIEIHSVPTKFATNWITFYK